MKQTEYDGMRYPSIDDLLEKVDSKYKLAYIAALRAKQIEQDPSFDDPDCKCVKPVGQALEEILNDKVSLEFEKVGY
jgi:DNA-directed RNA polymerase subunit omega